MLIKKNINKVLLFFYVIAFTSVSAQKPTVYKINELLNRINNDSDTTYVVNFWATWCKPCVAELPEFEKLHLDAKDNNRKTKVLLVSMDFVEELDKKLKDFLAKNKYTCEVVLLDEINGNNFINKISEKWSGAIPATLITKKDKAQNYFHEGKMTFDGLQAAILKK
jgi:thiol-disulfide isomerase/thioredoxin